MKRGFAVKAAQVTKLNVRLASIARVGTIFLVVTRDPTGVDLDKKPNKVLASSVKKEGFNLFQPKFHVIKHVHWASMATSKEKQMKMMLASPALVVQPALALG